MNALVGSNAAKPKTTNKQKPHENEHPKRIHSKQAGDSNELLSQKDLSIGNGGSPDGFAVRAGPKHANGRLRLVAQRHDRHGLAELSGRIWHDNHWNGGGNHSRGV